MSTEVAELTFSQVDPHLSVAYLAVPTSRVLMLQVFFELYDGCGTVRTVTSPNQAPTKDAIACVMAAAGQVETASNILYAIRDRIQWRPIAEVIDPFIGSISQSPTEL